MNTLADARRRWFGLFFLIAAVGLLTWGQTLLRPHLRGLVFVIYWISCLCCTGLALVMAWLDIRAIRRSAREQRRELVGRALHSLQPPPKESPKRETTPSGS